jgi:predicted MFS family arabinose efflux permease
LEEAATQMAEQGVTARQEWSAHWGLVLAAMLGMSFATIPTVVLGQFIPPLQASFGWSRSEISAGLTVLALVSTPLAPFAGALADRFGSRAIAVPGMLLSALVYAGFGLISGTIWIWFAAWTAYALASLLIRSMIWNRAASNAFSANRGLALAVIMSGSSLGQIAGPVIAQFLIEGYGWRLAFASLGLGWGGIAFVCALLLFREARVARPVPGAEAGTASPQVPGLTLKQALRDWRIVRIGFAILVASLMAAGFVVHLFPLLTGAGVGPIEAASLVAAMGGAGLVGQFATGWLADRSRGWLLPVLCFAIPTMGYIVTLLALAPGPLLWLGVAMVGYGGGAAMNITVILITRCAGLAHFGKIFGVISSCMGLGAGIGAMLAGAIFDATGSYDGFLISAAAAMALGALAHFRLAPEPRFDR